MKVVLDTNILISAIGWEGKPRVILEKCLDNRFRLATSHQILAEVCQVLARKKFSFIDKTIRDEFIMLLSGLAEIVNPREKINICRDKEDNKFIEAALAAKADHIVTGDYDLLEIKKYGGIRILSADEFLRSLR
ncbi:MAG: putative toxin-antitoxin system toxin component, PIN family [archaeon]